MDILQKTMELDCSYLETFTTKINKDWGYLFINEAQPDYYDANHAHIHTLTKDPNSVIAEVVEFYQNRKIIPRFYIYNNDESLISALRSYEFKIERLETTLQVWNGHLTSITRNNNVSIEKVDNHNFHDALEVECSIKELGGREVREKAFTEEFRHPAFTYYLLRINDQPASTACLFSNGKQARLENVATLEKYRGQGLIGHLIQYIQKETVKNGFEDLWVVPINEKVEKVYQKYGFDTIGRDTTFHAFLGGKSIGEIREGN